MFLVTKRPDQGCGYRYEMEVEVIGIVELHCT